jgi:hypothetical protein
MSLSEEVIDGTLQPDGSLRLAHPARLPPGPVQVTIRSQPAVAAPAAGWWEGLQAARQRMEEAGCRFMDEAEVRDHIEWLRQGDHIDDLLRAADEAARQPGRP